jgi:DNA polymerase-3 subunit beta
MRVELSKEKLLPVVSIAEKISGRDVAHPILHNLFLSAEGNTLTVRATNLDIGAEFTIPAKVEREGEVVVSGKTLLATLVAMHRGVAVILQLEGENLLLSDEGSKSLLKVHPPDDFPTIPNIRGGKGILFESKTLLNGFASVWYCASSSTIKPELSSVYIYQDGNQLFFVATDSFRLAEKKVLMREAISLGRVLVPFRNIPEITRVLEYTPDASVTVYLSENQLSFEFDGVYLTSRLIDGTFPDYRQIIPKEAATEVVLLKQDLVQALKKTAVFLDKFGQVTMRIQPKKKTFSLHSLNADVGETAELLQAAITGDGLDISFNQRYISDSLQSIHSDSISLSFTGLSKPMVMRGVSDNSFLYLVMPMNK